MTLTRLCVGGALAMVLAGGCDRLGRAVVGEVMRAASPEVEAPALKPVSEDETKTFVRDLKAAVDAGDAAAIERLVDLRAMIKRALSGVRLPEKVVNDTIEGFKKGARSTGLVAQLAGIRDSGAQFDWLASRKNKEGRHVTFRALAEEGGVEHYTFLLSKVDDGRSVAFDVSFLTAGEAASVSMRRLLLGAFAADKSFLEQLKGDENLWVKHLPKISQAMAAQAQGRHAEALAMVETLPAPLKEQKHMLLLRMQLSSSDTEDPRYAQVLATMLEKFPDDPAAAVASIDHFFLKKDFAKALAAIEVVEKEAAPDPYFGVLKVNALSEMGRLDEAKKVAMTTIEREPTLLPAHFALVAVLLAQKDHPATARKLLDMRDQFALSYHLEGEEAYADFIASRDYRQFKRALAQGRRLTSAP